MLVCVVVGLLSSAQVTLALTLTLTLTLTPTLTLTLTRCDPAAEAWAGPLHEVPPRDLAAAEITARSGETTSRSGGIKARSGEIAGGAAAASALDGRYLLYSPCVAGSEVGRRYRGDIGEVLGRYTGDIGLAARWADPISPLYLPYISPISPRRAGATASSTTSSRSSCTRSPWRPRWGGC